MLRGRLGTSYNEFKKPQRARREPYGKKGAASARRLKRTKQDFERPARKGEGLPVGEGEDMC